jgi:hypothetical protein
MRRVVPCLQTRVLEERRPGFLRRLVQAHVQRREYAERQALDELPHLGQLAGAEPVIRSVASSRAGPEP